MPMKRTYGSAKADREVPAKSVSRVPMQTTDVSLPADRCRCRRAQQRVTADGQRVDADYALAGMRLADGNTVAPQRS